MTDYDDHFLDDGPGDEPELRVFEDGTCVAASERLPGCVTFSRVVEEPEYDDERFVDGVSRHIVTKRVTPESIRRWKLALPRPNVRVQRTARSTIGRRRRRVSRTGLRRARSPGREAEDPSDPADASLAGGVG
jgi:hypothetical protein